jgi:transcription elongation factor GreB
MSKAFTRESEDSIPEETWSARRSLTPGTRNYITADGADRLKQELDELLEQKRGFDAKGSNVEPTVKAIQQKLEFRIRMLQQTLGSVVVAKMPAERDKVAFGARVKVRHGNGEEEFYHIVGVEEAAPEGGRISCISPLARALLSRKSGEKVSFQSPAGTEELTILEVSY